MASERTGQTIDIDKIDYDDPAVYASLGTGKTDGVFQLESSGMKGFMKELKPKSMEDVIAWNFPVPSGTHGLHSPVHQG